MSGRMTDERLAELRCVWRGGDHLSESEQLEMLDALVVERACAESWRNAIVDAAVVGWTYDEKTETDPAHAVAKMLYWERMTALDPNVSEEAAKLIAERDAAESELAQYRAASVEVARLEAELADMREGGWRGKREWESIEADLRELALYREASVEGVDLVKPLHDHELGLCYCDRCTVYRYAARKAAEDAG
jgi:hypothetical protein